MKKLIYCALALTAGLFAASCQQENLEPVAQENTVTYTVEVPGVATKAYGEGLEVNQLIYEVWKTDETGEINDNAVRLYQVNDKELQLVDGVKRANITLNLVKDQTYRILLWAQVKEANGFVYYTTENLTNVSYKHNLESSYSANQEKYDAFYATKVISTFTAPKPEKISLKRPFAQLNIATENNVTDYTVTMNTSKVVVEGVPTVFNVATSEASALTTVTFNTFDVPEGTVTVTTDAQSKSYDYAAMNYVFASKSGINAKVSYDINSTLTSKNLDGSNGVETEAKVSNIISNVPLKENYRTNIVGNLLSSSTEYEIVVDAEFETDGNGDMFVINDGLIKNINGDYEVTNENGLEYAIENLFAQGGNFYLTAELYDMTDYDVNTPSVPAGKVLNIYGETPVVTRSATASFAGVTIIGLDKIIDVISKDANVSISGVKLTDDGSVLVGTNNGTLVVSDATGEEAIVGSGAAIEAGEIKDLATLNAALATGVKTIEIAADIKADKVVLIKSSVVINGNDKTFTTSANRAFRLTTSDIEVTFNNLDIVSDAVRVGTNDVRGVSVDDVENITLTLNDCSHDFNDPSANDWAYAVNVTGGTNHTVTVNGGVYEGANVINVLGTAQTVTVKNATLNSTYPYNDQYYGACIYVIQNQGSSVYAEGNTFNGDNAIAFNLGTGTALEEKNNTDNTMYYREGVCYVKSAEKLQTAINNAKAGENNIAFSNDITGNVTVVQKPGVKITIDGCAKKYNGFIKVHSNSNHYADAALTIKNVNFETSTPAINFIEALENGSERYSTNITAENCSFTATDAAVNTTVGLQIKASKNAKVLNCTATDMHSLIQAQSCDETVVVNGCTINGKNGVAFKQVKAATVEGTRITAQEYGIRFDGNTDNYSIVLKNNNVTAYQPLIVRKMTGANNTITLEGENTLTTDEIYQIVITNGSDDADYVTPTGTYTLTGADDFVVYPRVNYGSKVSDGLYKNEVKYYVTNAAGLETMNQMFADKEFDGRDVVLNLYRDIDFTGKTWTPVDSHADKKFEIAEINGNGHTISNLTINGQAMFTRFAGSGDVVVKDITFDNATVNSNGSINTSIVVGHTYQNVLFDNVDVKNSSITGGYKVAPLIGTVYNESTSTIAANLKNCDVEDVTVKATSYDFCTTGMVAFVYAGDNDTIAFEKCTVTNVKLYAPAGYTAHAAIYTTGSETLFNEAEGVTVTNVTFENI